MSAAHNLVKALLDAEPVPPGKNPRKETAREFIKRVGMKKRPDSGWIKQAVKDLEAETGLVFSPVSHVLDNVYAFGVESRGGWEFQVYESEEAAFNDAVERVIDDLRDNPELFMQTWLQGHINLDRVRRALQSDEENNMREQFDDEFGDYAGKRDELIDRGYLQRGDFFTENEDGEIELEIDDTLKWKIDSAVERHIDDAITSRLEDPLEYLREIYGPEDAIKQAIQIGGINYKEAARDAIATDGLGHFLSGYDNTQIDLEHGAVAFRTN